MTTFTKTLTAFCDDLRLSLPELSTQIDRAATMVPADFLKAWRPHLVTLKTRDVAALFQKRGGSLIGSVMINKKVWAELSEKTQGIIWKYLRTLALEATIEVGLDKMDEPTMELLLEILAEEKGSPSAEGLKQTFEDAMKNMKPLLDRLKDFMGTSFDVSGASFPEIPEHLRNGRIAKLAEELTKQFDPLEFGIDPELLKGDNLEVILTTLAATFKDDPTKLMTGAKAMAEKIKKKISNGSIKREELLEEAKEFMALFKDHPLFKEAIGKAEGMMGGLGGLGGMFGSDAEPSARRSTVQERLRKKMAERKNGGPK